MPIHSSFSQTAELTKLTKLAAKAFPSDGNKFSAVKKLIPLGLKLAICGFQSNAIPTGLLR